MICSNCGYNMPDNASFCPSCGQGIQNYSYERESAHENYNQQSYAQPAYNQQGYNQQGYYQQNAGYGNYAGQYPNASYTANSDVSTSKTLAIIGLVTMLLGMHIVAIVLTAIGSSKASSVLAMMPGYQPALEARRFNKIVMTITIIIMALGIIVSVAASIFFFAIEGWTIAELLGEIEYYL